MDVSDDMTDLNGAESYLVGLSPQYWACTPLLVKDLHGLSLVNGFDCLLMGAGKSCDTCPRRQVRFVPLSKCTLIGVIVSAQYKSNGCMQYLIDDGTGLVDCIAWSDSDVYSLPKLVPDMNISTNELEVGDLIEVHGRIRTVSIGAVTRVVQQKRKAIEMKESVREVHASSIEKTTMERQNHHWLNCIQFQQDCERDYFAVSSTSLEHRETATKIKNGVDVLRELGPKIANEAVAHTDLPSARDSVGAWRVFGLTCRCHLSYKESLLYCHCIATPEALDPNLTFRDALLQTLRTRQQRTEKELRFLYQDMYENTTLRETALAVLKNHTEPRVMVDRIYIKTFACLRKDGVLFLFDEQSDSYLLITKEKVLEPYVKNVSSRMSQSSLKQRLLHAQRLEGPLSAVPSSRIQYVRKLLDLRPYRAESVSETRTSPRTNDEWFTQDEDTASGKTISKL